MSKESPVLRDHPRLEKAKSKAMVSPGLYQGPMCIRLGASSDVVRLKRFRILTFHERIGFFWAKICVKFPLFYHVLTYLLPSILHIGESKLLQWQVPDPGILGSLMDDIKKQKKSIMRSN